jgi:hypothetical protein
MSLPFKLDFDRQNISFQSFKIWNYIGECVYTCLKPQNVELWQVLWQPGLFTASTSVKVVKKPVVAQEEGLFQG